MKRKSISTAEFMRHFGRYHDEAQKSPITLTKHGRPSVVVVPVELFEKMLGSEDPRISYAAGEMPDELADIFKTQLEKDSDDYRKSRDEQDK
ncbi:type II toxin-antitoxin system prevent-host-death family antitoxin [Agrobacterium fabrum]|jgi:prevent-host-death family protein|uniref:Antitoxin n=1 Tax=Agrobacterium fabrum TaxID=1176649 RepID=A0A7Z7BJA0_9HYPH|nr:type II toxin-antitoxin system prevent-host-death family antitoxin [Agrobacterium fabrum]MCR6725227.1 type II toxin-antitoxin system prevent-host-death family antitoxin [Agrobacterium fabrum]UXT57040.1 type II toxin-antitoxin system Phd/YefM family antitoxin [Agrobacterium fabrum]WCK77267.1 type II toxin-antitoxin system prevent-host-death family antitoxin [Agrobacterium fabrum]WIE28348.1 type II toxin-antitoxin system prevent-host-death family antitoxin [Agrobacterium fabrum]WIE44306.1 typ